MDRWKLSGYRFAHGPSQKMTLSMVDPFLFGFQLARLQFMLL